MSVEEFAELARSVAEIRARLGASAKLLHDIINEGIATLENLRDLRDHHMALVKEADLLAAQLAGRSGS